VQVITPAGAKTVAKAAPAAKAGSAQ